MDSSLAVGGVTRPDVMKLKALENSLISLAIPFNLDLKSAPASTYHHLSNSSTELVAFVTKQIADLAEVFIVCATQDLNPWDDTEFFNISMRRMGLTMPSDFLDHVHEGDVIEGYDMDRIQVFRNMTFMQKSGYSLVEMLSYEWPTLFDRSNVITQKMISFCDEILWAKNRTIPFDIPKHFIRERQSSERITFEVQFRHLTPMFSGPNRPFGILACHVVNPVAVTDPIDKLAFV